MMGRDVCVFKTAMRGTKALYCILTSDFSGPDLGYISDTVQKLRFNLSWILLEYMLHVLRPGLQMLPIPSFYSKGAETRSRSMWSEIPANPSFLPSILPSRVAAHPTSAGTTHIGKISAHVSDDSLKKNPHTRSGLGDGDLSGTAQVRRGDTPRTAVAA